MNQDFLNKAERIDSIMAKRIAGRIHNRKEVLKSEEQEKFEERVNKGEVEVITVDSLPEDAQLVKGEDYKTVENKCEQLIEKGEKDVLLQDEWDWLNDQQEMMKGFVEKAIPVPDGEGSYQYEQVFVNEGSGEGKEEDQ